MYKIIGSDGNEYGPVNREEMCQWIAEGRLNGESRAKAGEEGAFRPLQSFPEFADALTPKPAGDGIPTIAPLPSREFQPHDYELDIGGCVAGGYQVFKENFSLLFLTALTLAAIEGFVVGLGIIPVVGSLASIVNMIISGPLLGGVYLVFLRAQRGEPAEVGEMFAGFREGFGQLFLGKFIPGLVAGLCFLPLIVAAVIVVALPAVEQHHPPDAHRLLVLAPIFLVCLLPVLYLQTCWAFTLPLIIDKHLDFGAAMKTSWRMVNQHWWQVFILILLIALINFAGAMACGVGLLFSVPIGFGAYIHAYETIFGAEKN